MLYKGQPVYLSNILSELFFLQNFRENIMGISWTLAIEEHFYFFLIACAFLGVRKNLLANGKIVWRFCLSILLLCLFARLVLNIRLPFDESTHFFPTYLRIDALMFGVLISWFYHFRPKEYAAFLKKNRHWIIGLSLIGLSLPFLFPVEHSIMNTIGLSLLYVSFGGLVCFTEKTVLFKHRVFEPLVYIGRYSYSIYLVHLLCGPPISNFFRQYIFTMPELEWLNKTLYFLSNIVVGILISLFIEQPFLRLRERYFPKKNEKHKALPSTLKPERVV
jgi:peptidoglycan/LPS O-acetylase OafA/YrhL